MRGSATVAALCAACASRQPVGPMAGLSVDPGTPAEHQRLGPNLVETCFRLTRPYPLGAITLGPDAEICHRWEVVTDIVTTDGGSWRATLHGPHHWAGQELPAGTRLELEVERVAGVPEARLVTLEYDGELDLFGIPIDGTAGARPHEASLASARVAREVEVDGVPIREDTEVTFHADGRIASAMLARDTELFGVPCDGDARVELDSEGRLRRCQLAVALPADTLSCAALHDVVLLENGAVAGCTLEPPQEVDGVWARTVGRDTTGGWRVTLAQEVQRIDGFPCDPTRHPQIDDGKLRSCVLALDLTLDGVEIPAGAIVSVDEGRVTQWSAVFQEDRVLQGVPVRGGGFVTFYGNGRVMKACPMAAVTLDGTPFPAGDWVDFTPDGRVEPPTSSICDGRKNALSGGDER